MIPSVHFRDYTYSIPYINFTLSETTLRVTQVTLGMLSGLGLMFGGLSQYYLPSSWLTSSWLTPSWSCTVGIALLGLGGTCMFKQNNLPDRESLLIPLIPPQQIPSEHLQLIHELCEITVEGVSLECSLERVHAILSELQKGDNLRLLNTIPSYYLEQQRSPIFQTPLIQFTPLQHWASKGNLEVVKLLLEHGAVDYCAKSPPGTTSALYEAALHGQIEVVDFLLGSGAHADLAFNGNVLRYFIPKFVFQLIQRTQAQEISVACLDHILISLSKNQPENLKLQLKIPVNEGENVLCWIDKNRGQTQSTIAQQIMQMLIGFGATEQVYSLDDLCQQQMEVGTGITLCAESSLKT